MTQGPPRIVVEGLAMGFGERVVQRDISFTVERGTVLAVMGQSGSGKSTLLRHMIGLVEPLRGRVAYDGEDYWPASPEERVRLNRRFGILFQGGALWSSMTVAENVALPLAQYTRLSAVEIAEMVALKLALVGLSAFGESYPSELSGGMKKRAGLARAIALDPDILFFDEPSAGLDPLSSRRLDELILELRHSLGATVILVTHELDSIYRVADDAIFLDADRHTLVARGAPRELAAHCPDDTVRAFLSRTQMSAEA